MEETNDGDISICVETMAGLPRAALRPKEAVRHSIKPVRNKETLGCLQSDRERASDRESE